MVEVFNRSLSVVPDENVASAEFLSKDTDPQATNDHKDLHTNTSSHDAVTALDWNPSEHWRGHSKKEVFGAPRKMGKTSVMRSIPRPGAVPLIDVARPEVHHSSASRTAAPAQASKLENAVDLLRAELEDIDEGRSETVYGLLPVDPRLLGVESVEFFGAAPGAVAPTQSPTVPAEVAPTSALTRLLSWMRASVLRLAEILKSIFKTR